ncbi:DNA mismatch repair endonuclease MutL [Leptolyngbya sp. FACHB-261]|uniref:DNA mismatch repair endonuclease MutL n=1 Tax=Leptolyngbya sp. FACHB-261 TaxID=2692806 RepID=UPI001686C768|nr:DNA mismatch repair endonuclease MutL [Leptolyngbya sp. FACHB-261]MBD2102208.1 DNA mismatch repair endonuclease MutL [Leptolyngbya sp. FACHB-261]
MGAISALPGSVVDLIAAGEVIDSLAAAVRELIENALDAGATRIGLALWPDEWRMQVSDNGCGMDLTDLKVAATAHATSKIRAAQDLWQISSLGFRGEALHSLAQLGDLEICSRSREAVHGWQMVYDAQGQPQGWEVSGLAPGTVVTVANLFERWATRRAGLPSLPQQVRSVQQIIYGCALTHPGVTWRCELRGKPWFSLWPGEAPLALLPQIVPTLAATDLRHLSTTQLSVTLGLPDRCHRHRPDWVKVAVNGRFVRLPELEHTIFSAFSRTLRRDRYPVCLVHLYVPPEQIDWNRHPAKLEVYLHQLSHWQEQVAALIKQALQTVEPERSRRSIAVIKAAEERGSYRTIGPAPDSSLSEASTPQSPGRGLGQLRALAQVHKTYILAEHPAGLWLVEQHIAHERVLFEALEDRWVLVELPGPVVLGSLKPQQVEQLQNLELDVEPFGEDLWAVRSAPEPLSQREDCKAALLELSLCSDLQTARVATACRSAIRNGTPLESSQQQALLEQWQRTRNPHTCPHGRPIYMALEETDLARFFKRHWVIGKSHGI